jgi:thioesterase domain-containing protein
VTLSSRLASPDTPPASPSPAASGPLRKTLWVARQGNPSGGSFAFVLAGYGDAWPTYELARGFRPERTVYALQPPHSFTRGTAATLSSLTEEYVRCLRERQPSGPYCVGGYSAGGPMALEIARQLRAQGEEMRLVALLDPLFAHYRALATLGYRAMKRAIQAVDPLAKGRRIRLLRILSAMIRDEGLETHLKLLEGHRPEPYPGEVVLFQTRTSFLVRPPGVIAQWRRIAAGGLRVRYAPGTHHSFMRPPHVLELARLLDAHMDEAGQPARA